MIDLDRQIAQIESLLEQGDARSLTYAALECRLAIERICYERLRNVRDYISDDQLRRWQPRHVMNRLIKDVDSTIATTRSFYMAKLPAQNYGEEGPKDDDFIEIGTEIGFNPDLLGRLWNALSNVALHIKIPNRKDERIEDYGDCNDVENKVIEALNEIKRISRSTMSMTPSFDIVSFECKCSTLNKKTETSLLEGGVIICINPDCDWRYTSTLVDGRWLFEARRFKFECKCGTACSIPERAAQKIGHGQTERYNCHRCGQATSVTWALVRLEG